MKDPRSCKRYLRAPHFNTEADHVRIPERNTDDQGGSPPHKKREDSDHNAHGEREA